MARVYDVEVDIRYISVRMLLWLAAAGVQWVWIGLKSSVVSHTTPLAKVIAAATSVFALRDVFMTIFISSPSVILLYWSTLWRTLADGVFVVRSLCRMDLRLAAAHARYSFYEFSVHAASAPGQACRFEHSTPAL